MKTLFETIGFRLGQKAAQAKNAFDLIGGTEEDSLRAERHLGRELAAAFLERIPLVEENETTRFAAQIGCWLAANVKEKKLPLRRDPDTERELLLLHVCRQPAPNLRRKSCGEEAPFQCPGPPGRASAFGSRSAVTDFRELAVVGNVPGSAG